MAPSAAPLICAVAVLLLLQQSWSSSMVLGACVGELSSACGSNDPDVATCCATVTNLITTDRTCVCTMLNLLKANLTTSDYQAFLGACSFNVDPCTGGTTTTTDAASPTSSPDTPSSTSDASPTSSSDTPSTPEAPTTPSSETSPSTPSTGTKAPATSSPATSSSTPSEAKVISKNGALREKSLWSTGIVLAAAWTSLAIILDV